MILILGASGQVGRALQAVCSPHCVALGRAEADLAAPETLPGVLARYKPTVVINAAAYTAVDKAEEERELAHCINSVAPGIIAQWCAGNGVPLIHYSTDYVFDGSGDAPKRETDATNSCNYYGESKLAGERAIIRAGGNYLIFRTSWVYDAQGKNFFTTMLRLGAEKETLRVVADQHGAPTYAPHLAEATWRALMAARSMGTFPSGIYHLCNGGETTWHRFAESIFANARKKNWPLRVQLVEAITTNDYPTPAARPLNSRLSCMKAKEVLGVSLPAWQEGLDDCMSRFIPD